MLAVLLAIILVLAPVLFALKILSDVYKQVHEDYKEMDKAFFGKQNDDESI